MTTIQEIIKQYLQEHFSKTTEPILLYHKYTLDELLDMIMLTQKKLPDISIYNITDGFHMEMRIFSLDDLFKREKEVNALKVVNEINSFVEKTEHFFVTIIDRLNK